MSLKLRAKMVHLDLRVTILPAELATQAWLWCLIFKGKAVSTELYNSLEMRFETLNSMCLRLKKSSESFPEQHILAAEHLLTECSLRKEGKMRLNLHVVL